MNKKSIFFSLVVGMILSIAVPFQNEVSASMGECTYQYCASNKKCRTNQNATDCYGPGGQEPCTSSKPCFKPE